MYCSSPDNALQGTVMTKGNVPPHFRYLNPILEVLQALGGFGKPSVVIDRVIEKLNISEEELQETVERGQPKVINQIHWAKLMLAKSDHLDSSSMGVWRLTEKGLSATLSEVEMMPIWQFMMLRKSPKSLS